MIYLTDRHNLHVMYKTRQTMILFVFNMIISILATCPSPHVLPQYSLATPPQHSKKKWISNRQKSILTINDSNRYAFVAIDYYYYK